MRAGGRSWRCGRPTRRRTTAAWCTTRPRRAEHPLAAREEDGQAEQCLTLLNAREDTAEASSRPRAPRTARRRARASRATAARGCGDSSECGEHRHLRKPRRRRGVKGRRQRTKAAFPGQQRSVSDAQMRLPRALPPPAAAATTAPLAHVSTAEPLRLRRADRVRRRRSGPPESNSQRLRAPPRRRRGADAAVLSGLRRRRRRPARRHPPACTPAVSPRW